MRDSGPYLHDGRSGTLEQAIAFLGGESRAISAASFQLAADRRQALLRFLKSPEAPFPELSRDRPHEGQDAGLPRDPLGLR